MEVPEINMIINFEAGMNCLQNPSLNSRFFSFRGLEKGSQIYSLWKWGALLFAFFAAFSSIIRRVKRILIRFHTAKPSSHQNEEVIEFNDDDEISLASSDDDEQGQNKKRRATSCGGQQRVDEDYSVKGTSRLLKGQWSNLHLRQRKRGRCGGAWSEFASAKSVVKLWDSLGLSLDFDEDLYNYSPQSVVSTWDCDRHLRKNTFTGGIWNIPTAAGVAPAGVVLTAKGNREGDGVILGGYDTRMRRRVPALYAKWSLPDTAATEKVAGVANGGVAKVYLRDDVRGMLTVGDVRNVRRPLESVTESDGDSWWDADAVTGENE